MIHVAPFRLRRHRSLAPLSTTAIPRPNPFCSFPCNVARPDKSETLRNPRARIQTPMQTIPKKQTQSCHKYKSLQTRKSTQPAIMTAVPSENNTTTTTTATTLPAAAATSPVAEPDAAIAKQMLFASVISQCVNSTTGHFDKDQAFDVYYTNAGFTTDPIICMGGVRNSDCCIVSTIKDAVVVAFRGTTSAASDWLMDAHVGHGHQKDLQNPPKFPGRLHTGFLAAASHVWSEKAFNRAPEVGAKVMEWRKAKGQKRERPKYFAMDEIERLVNETGFSKVYITGHSKGGAMATVASWFCYKDLEHLDIVPECYTFASPTPADETFAAAYNDVITQFGYENYYDIVPLSPLSDPMYLSDLMRLIPGNIIAKVMQVTMAFVVLLARVVRSIVPWETLTERLFDYVPVGHRFVMKDGVVFEFAAGDYVGEAFDRFRADRWKDITGRLSKVPLGEIGKCVGAEHSKRCGNDPLVPSKGVYTALVKAEETLRAEIVALLEE